MNRLPQIKGTLWATCEDELDVIVVRVGLAVVAILLLDAAVFVLLRLLGNGGGGVNTVRRERTVKGDVSELSALRDIQTYAAMEALTPFEAETEAAPAVNMLAVARKRVKDRSVRWASVVVAVSAESP